MSKCDIWPLFECQNRIFNGKMRYSAPVRMSKYDFECENAIFGPCSNVKIGFLMAKCDIRHLFECQNTILNVKMRYSASMRMSK